MDNHTPDPTPLKYCPSCKQNKPATTEYFATDNRAKDALRSYCKACVKARYGVTGKQAEYSKRRREKNPDRESARKKREYEKNKERYKRSGKKWREANKEEIAQKNRERFQTMYADPDLRANYLAKNKAWRAAHPEYWENYYKSNAETIKERARRWHFDNPERRRQTHRNWRLNNPDLARRISRRATAIYLQRKRVARGTHTAADVRNQYEAQKGKCYYCSCKLDDNFHTDHVIPLSRGGSDGPENIVVACAPCNLSKGARLPVEWDGSNRLL